MVVTRNIGTKQPKDFSEADSVTPLNVPGVYLSPISRTSVSSFLKEENVPYIIMQLSRAWFGWSAITERGENFSQIDPENGISYKLSL